MAYGDRRVNKLPSDFGISDYFGLSFAGALGIVTAMLVDLQQSADASALFVINRWMGYLGAIFGFGELPLYSVLLIMMGIGALSIFYFQPVSFQAAFAQGFGVLAALMTIAPADLGGALNAPMEGEILPAPTVEEARLDHYGNQSNVYEMVREASWVGSISGSMAQNGLQQAVYRQPEKTQLVTAAYQSNSGNTNSYNIRIVIDLPNGLPRNIDAMIRSGTLRGRLFNETSGKTYNLFRNGGARIEADDNSITIETSLPGNGDTVTLWARVECSRYQIAVESFEAVRGDNATWEISMTPSKTPLFLQRLGNSYWF